jgi:hypothetical protein
MWPFDHIRRVRRQWSDLLQRVQALEGQNARLREALGRIESRQLAAAQPASTQDAEYRVFSQWGEDGIIDWLTRVVPVPRKLFVEFGVEDYTEANTRFLLMRGGWEGVVLDGSERNIKRIQRDPIYWQHPLTAIASFITRENINGMLAKAGASGPIGLLSIDVDGNDYWIWEAITVAEPAIAICEYNAIFGPERRVTIPYDASFVRERAHWSHLYAGASLAALHALGARKGYALVGVNRAGNNAFFVREELYPANLRKLTATEAYRPAQFRESRDESGRLTFLPAAEAVKLIEHLPLVEVPAG